LEAANDTEAAQEEAKDAAHEGEDDAEMTSGWRGILQRFRPAWFLINMGTGIVSILLFNLPYPYETTPDGRTLPEWTMWLSVAVFILNVVLFLIITVIGVLRYAMYPQAWNIMVRHPVKSLFLGTFPMGFSTIGVSFSNICVAHFGWGGPSGWAEMFNWAMWWIDSILSVAVAIGVAYMIITSHRIKLPQQTAVMLLPVVAPIVASAHGAVVASKLSSPSDAVTTVMVSLVLWAIGVPTAMMILALYFHRLTLHKLPSKEVIVSMFLPLGPIGQGGYAIQALGTIAADRFPEADILDPLAGRVFYILGFLVACVLWGFGLIWLCFAVVPVLHNRFPFNMSWWSFTFPLGVYAMSTITMGKDMPSTAFAVLGTIFAVAVILLWMMVSALTMGHAFSRLAGQTRRNRDTKEVSNEALGIEMSSAGVSSATPAR